MQTLLHKKKKQIFAQQAPHHLHSSSLIVLRGGGRLTMSRVFFSAFVIISALVLCFLFITFHAGIFVQWHSRISLSLSFSYSRTLCALCIHNRHVATSKQYATVSFSIILKPVATKQRTSKILLWVGA